jgi:hypothetical protein
MFMRSSSDGRRPGCRHSHDEKRQFVRALGPVPIHARLSNGYSKKLKNHTAAVTLFVHAAIFAASVKRCA